MPVEYSDSLFQSKKIYQKSMTQKIKAGLLAAGLGRRMEPLSSNHLPKPMFPLGGKIPMLSLWVKRFAQCGITNLSINLSVLGETIQNYYMDGSRFGVTIDYINEIIPTGTLGGICKHSLGRDAISVYQNEVLPDLNPFCGETLIIPSGDIVTNITPELIEEMLDIHQQAGAALSMILTPIPWDRRKDFGTALFKSSEKRSGQLSCSGQIKQFLEKDPNSPSNLNNASIYIIENEFLKRLDKLRTEANIRRTNPFYDFGKHVFPAMLNDLAYLKLSKEDILFGIQYDGEWFDVGNKRDYLNVNASILDGDIPIELPFEKMIWGYIGYDTLIDFSKVTIKPPVLIGNRCQIEPGVTLGPYAIIGDGWTIQRGAQIRRSVLWERYPSYNIQGVMTPLQQREKIDAHIIQENVVIDQSIIAGGKLQEGIYEKVVYVSSDGKLVINPINYIPEGPRA